MTYDVVIIGAGPAGYTAGIYCSRARHSTVLISGLLPGGQLMNTTDVENYPGFDEGVMGPDLMQTMRKQTERMGTEIVDDVVTSVDFTQKPLKVATASKFSAEPFLTIVIFLILSFCSIVLTTSCPETTCPNTECLLSSHGVSL